MIVRMTMKKPSGTTILLTLKTRWFCMVKMTSLAQTNGLQRLHKLEVRASEIIPHCHCILISDYWGRCFECVDGVSLPAMHLIKIGDARTCSTLYWFVLMSYCLFVIWSFVLTDLSSQIKMNYSHELFWCLDWDSSSCSSIFWWYEQPPSFRHFIIIIVPIHALHWIEWNCIALHHVVCGTVL